LGLLEGLVELEALVRHAHGVGHPVVELAAYALAFFEFDPGHPSPVQEPVALLLRVAASEELADLVPHQGRRPGQVFVRRRAVAGEELEDANYPVSLPDREGEGRPEILRRCDIPPDGAVPWHAFDPGGLAPTPDAAR
jgi:hypothetical protein